MPGNKHLSKASKKENRMYEHIRDSEMKEGRGAKRAKQIAAATVRKRQGSKKKAAGKKSSKKRM